MLDAFKKAISPVIEIFSPQSYSSPSQVSEMKASKRSTTRFDDDDSLLLIPAESPSKPKGRTTNNSQSAGSVEKQALPSASMAAAAAKANAPTPDSRFDPTKSPLKQTNVNPFANTYKKHKPPVVFLQPHLQRGRPKREPPVSNRQLLFETLKQDMAETDNFQVEEAVEPEAPAPPPPFAPKVSEAKRTLRNLPPAPAPAPPSISPRRAQKDINKPGFFSSIDEVCAGKSDAGHNSPDPYDFKSSKQQRKLSDRPPTPFKPPHIKRSAKEAPKPKSSEPITIIDSEEEKEAPQDTAVPSDHEEEPAPPVGAGMWPRLSPDHILRSDNTIEITQSQIIFSPEHVGFGILPQQQQFKILNTEIERIEYSDTTPMIAFLLRPKFKNAEILQRTIMLKDKDTGEAQNRLVFKFSNRNYVEVLRTQIALPLRVKSQPMSSHVLLALDSGPPPTTARKPATRATTAAQAVSLHQSEVVLVYPAPPATDGIQITREDLGRLDPNEFLNDSIIDFYIKWLKLAKLDEATRNRFYFFSTFFFRKLHQKNTSTSNSIAKWTRKDDIFSKDFIVIPINESLHWNLMIVCYASKAVERAKNPALQPAMVITEEGADDEEKEEKDEKEKEPEKEEEAKEEKKKDEKQQKDEIKDDIEEVSDSAKPKPKKAKQMPIEAFTTTSPRKPPLTTRDAMEIEEKRTEPHTNGGSKEKQEENVAPADSNDRKRKKGGRPKKDEVPIPVDDATPEKPKPAPVVVESADDSLVIKRQKKPLPSKPVEVPPAKTETIPNSPGDTSSSSDPERSKLIERADAFTQAVLASTVPGMPPPAPVPADDEDNVIVKPRAISAREAHERSEYIPTTRPVKPKAPPKPKPVTDPDMPCILIFDSLRLRSNSRTNTAIRKYLSEEWQRKRGEEFTFGKEHLPARVARVPTQDNSSDCGVYLLHFLERFAEDNIPVGELFVNGKEQWFTEKVIREKRENIRALIDREGKRQDTEKIKASVAAQVAAARETSPATLGAAVGHPPPPAPAEPGERMPPKIRESSPPKPRAPTPPKLRKPTPPKSREASPLLLPPPATRVIEISSQSPSASLEDLPPIDPSPTTFSTQPPELPLKKHTNDDNEQAPEEKKLEEKTQEDSVEKPDERPKRRKPATAQTEPKKGAPLKNVRKSYNK